MEDDEGAKIAALTITVIEKRFYCEFLMKAMVKSLVFYLCSIVAIDWRFLVPSPTLQLPHER